MQDFKLDLSNTTKDFTDEEFEKYVPKPVGYNLLVAMIKPPETFANSEIIKVADTMHAERILSMFGRVIDMGPLCYSGDKYGDPWCEVGDWVMFRSNSGTRFTVNGQEYRLMADDVIEATINDVTYLGRV